MIIKKIEIFGFGKFENRVFDFQKGPQLIFGENEAGKSTLYTFIRYILFGIRKPTNTRRNFKPYDYHGLYGGTIWFDTDQHQNVQLTRFDNQRDNIKANTARVQLEDGRTGDDRLLEKIIFPLTEELFLDVFSFQQEQLTELDQLSATQLEQTLVAVASTGSQRLLETATTLEQSAQALFKPTGSKPILNQKLTELQLLSQKIEEKESSESQYRDALLQMKTLDTKRETLQNQAAELKQLIAQKERQQRAFTQLKEYQRINKELQHRRILSAEERLKLTSIAEEYQVLSQQIHSLQKEIAVTKNDLLKNQNQSFWFFTKHQDAIQDLLKTEKKMLEGYAENKFLLQQLDEIDSQSEQLSEQWGFSTTSPPLLLDIVAKQELEDLHQVYQQLLETEKGLEMSSVTQATPKTDRTKSYATIGFATISAIMFILSLFLATPVNYVVRVLALILVAFSIYQFKKQHASSLDDAPLDERHSEQSNNARKKQEIETQVAMILKEHRWGKLTTLADCQRFGSMPETFLQLLERQKETSQLLEQTIAILQSYQEKTLFLEEWLPLSDKTLPERYRLIRDYADEMLIKQARELSANLPKLEDDLKLAIQQQTDFFDGHLPYLQTLNLDSLADIQHLLQDDQQSQALLQKQVTLEKELRSLFNLDELNSYNQLPQELDQLIAQLTRLEEQRDALQYEQTQLTANLDWLGKDGTLDELYQQRALLQDDVNRLSSQWLSLILEKELLNDLVIAMSDQTLPSLLETAQHYFQLLTNGKYQDIFLKNETLLIQNDKQQTFRTIDLSTGTKDQLYMALRLAFITSKDTVPAPIIIDDGWLHYDLARKKQLVLLLQSLPVHIQVILLTSDMTLLQLFDDARLPVTHL